MPNFVIRAETKAAMYEGYATVGIFDKETGALRTGGYFDDGTGWALAEHGPLMVETGNMIEGPMGEKIPETIPEGYYIALRWNGDAPTPPVPKGLAIVWSDLADAEGTQRPLITSIA